MNVWAESQQSTLKSGLKHVWESNARDFASRKNAGIFLAFVSEGFALSLATLSYSGVSKRVAGSGNSNGMVQQYEYNGFCGGRRSENVCPIQQQHMIAMRFCVTSRSPCEHTKVRVASGVLTGVLVAVLIYSVRRFRHYNRSFATRPL